MSILRMEERSQEVTRSLDIARPADAVWAWMSDVRKPMAINMFHERVEAPMAVRQKGMDVVIQHNFMGQRAPRIAKVNVYERYKVGWGELMPPESREEDPFPHSQTFTITPIDDNHCRVTTRLRGRYRMPAGAILGRTLFKRFTSAVLDLDLQQVAVEVGAMQPHEVRKARWLTGMEALIGAFLGAKELRKRFQGAPA